VAAQAIARSVSCWSPSGVARSHDCVEQCWINSAQLGRLTEAEVPRGQGPCGRGPPPLKEGHLMGGIKLPRPGGEGRNF
jgi:hypothetical protein